MQAKPWVTKAIRVSLNTKNKLFSNYQKTQYCYHFQKFKTYRNKLNRLIKLAKRMHYTNFFSKNLKNIESIWQGIKQIVTPKYQSFSIPTKTIKDNMPISDPKVIANQFNTYFINIAKKLANDTQLSSKRTYTDYLDHPL